MPFPPTTPRPAASATAHRAVPPRAMPAVLGDARDRRLWLCIATSTLLTLCLVRGAGLSITGATPFLLCGLAAVALRLAGPLLVPTRAAALPEAAGHYAAFMLIALTGATASYPISALTIGFHDAGLQRIDTLLGFDWLRWYRVVASHPALQWLGLAAYRSIYVTPALLLGYHAATGRRDAARRFLATFWLAAVLTLALFAFLPAVGPFSYLWRGPIPYWPDSQQWQIGMIPLLRSVAERTIDFAHLHGLVSAPSFHTAAAVLYIHAAWPIRRLRWPLLTLNAAMLLSTPVEGTHYLSDMLIGAVVAVAAVVIVRRALPDAA